jgi:hypothetical protein
VNITRFRVNIKYCLDILLQNWKKKYIEIYIAGSCIKKSTYFLILKLSVDVLLPNHKPFFLKEKKMFFLLVKQLHLYFWNRGGYFAFAK